MKGIYLTTLIFILLSGGNIFKLYAQNELSVVLFDGTNEQITLSNINNIKFTGNSISINLGSGTSSVHNFSTVRKLIFKVASGINDLKDNTQPVEIYPNPVQDILYFKNEITENSTLTIYSLEGIMVSNEIITSPANQINVYGLSKGFYILKINNQTVKFTKR